MGKLRRSMSTRKPDAREWVETQELVKHAVQVGRGSRAEGQRKSLGRRGATGGHGPKTCGENVAIAARSSACRRKSGSMTRLPASRRCLAPTHGAEIV